MVAKQLTHDAEIYLQKFQQITSHNLACNFPQYPSTTQKSPEVINS